VKPGFEVRIYPIARFSFLKQTLFAGIQPGFGYSKTGISWSFHFLQIHTTSHSHHLPGTNPVFELKSQHFS
jgi:hypothetical protein